MKIFKSLVILIGVTVIASNCTQQKATKQAEVLKYKMTTDIPEGILTPDKVETSIGTLEYFDGVPTKATTENVYNYLDRMRGVDAFLKGIPGASVRGLIMGVKNMGGDGFNKIYITETLLDSKSLFLTANTSTIYISPYIDLKENGPMVMEVPSGMLGAFNDAWFRYIADIGPFGEDKGVSIPSGISVVILRVMREKYHQDILLFAPRPIVNSYLCERPLRMALPLQ
ncbi:hypothetical protein ES705_35685 [subsurface metagenome]